MENEKMLLRYHYKSDIEESDYEVFFKVYSNFKTLKTSKEFNDKNPIHLEIARTDDFINDGEGISLTIEQTKELISTLQKAVDFLES
jgi:hypothetical protein